MTEYLQDGAWGAGVATITGDRVLETYYPDPRVGLAGAPEPAGPGEAIDDDRRRGANPRGVVGGAADRRGEEPGAGRPGGAPGGAAPLPRRRGAVPRHVG